MKQSPVKRKVLAIKTYCLLVVFCLFSSYGGAVEVSGLYQGSVSVESRENERERIEAFSVAMAEVLVKVSGQASSVNNSQIRRALSNPQAYVESWVYRSEIATTENSNLLNNDNASIDLEINFYETEIVRLLNDNNIAFWPSNRQETLVWLVVQEELGRREIINSTLLDDHQILTLMEQQSNLKGLPILLPLMDLDDQRNINADSLWELDETAILSASQRYQTESILAIRIYRSLSGELIARSAYFFQGRELPYQSFDDQLEDFISASVNLATNELSANYAILSSSINASIMVNLYVEGINSSKSYSELLTYIDSLTLVNDVQIASIDEENLVLRLSTGGRVRQLIETIALDSYLQLSNELRRNEDGVYMYYRWSE